MLSIEYSTQDYFMRINKSQKYIYASRLIKKHILTHTSFIEIRMVKALEKQLVPASIIRTSTPLTH